MKVEIDLPSNEDNHLKYSLITNSSDGNKIIYLRKKDNSDEAFDTEDAINKYAEEGDIMGVSNADGMKQKKKGGKRPIKNVQAFLTSTFPKQDKGENNFSKSGSGNILNRFSSVSSKGAENILEIETLKSGSSKSKQKKYSEKVGSLTTFFKPDEQFSLFKN